MHFVQAAQEAEEGEGMSAMIDRFNSNEDPAIIEREARLERVADKLLDLSFAALEVVEKVIDALIAERKGR